MLAFATVASFKAVNVSHHTNVIANPSRHSRPTRPPDVLKRDTVNQTPYDESYGPLPYDYAIQTSLLTVYTDAAVEHLFLDDKVSWFVKKNMALNILHAFTQAAAARRLSVMNSKPVDKRRRGYYAIPLPLGITVFETTPTNDIASTTLVGRTWNWNMSCARKQMTTSRSSLTLATFLCEPPLRALETCIADNSLDSIGSVEIETTHPIRIHHVHTFPFDDIWIHHTHVVTDPSPQNITCATCNNFAHLRPS
jgi:hypothetical protein